MQASIEQAQKQNGDIVIWSGPEGCLTLVYKFYTHLTSQSETNVTKQSIAFQAI